MKTRNYLLFKPAILFISVFIAGSLAGQHPNPGFQKQKEKIEAHKIAFLTDKLQLTPAEAEKFWPVYNENRDQVEKELKQFRVKHNFSPEDIENMSDEEALAFIDEQFEHEQKMLEMKKAFNEKLKKVLPPQKILHLFEAEHEFKVELMKRAAGRDRPPVR